MTTINELKRMVNEEKGRRSKRMRIAEAGETRVTSHSDVDNPEATHVDRKGPPPRRAVNQQDDGDKTTVDGNPYVTGDKQGSLSDAGKAALAANTVWEGVLTQMLNFSLGKQVATKIGAQLAQQVDLDTAEATKIAYAVLKSTLEELDDVASQEMQDKFPGVLDRTRG